MSKKPHDEEWKTGEGALSGALYSGDTWIGSFTDSKRARLAKEAPWMARALRDLDDDLRAHGYPQDSIARERIAAILKAAGVIL